MQFEVKGQTTQEKKLIQLETLLNIEIPVCGAVIWYLWVMPLQILIIVFVLAILTGVLFVLTKLVLLFQLRKFGWFSALILFVVVPLCVVPFLSDGSATYPIYYIYPLAFFAFYSITLRLVMPYWED